MPSQSNERLITSLNKMRGQRNALYQACRAAWGILDTEGRHPSVDDAREAQAILSRAMIEVGEQQL